MKSSLIVLLLAMMFVLAEKCQTKSEKESKPFTQSFTIDSCTFRTSGRTTYFILEPGFRLILKGHEGQDSTTLVITVLNETKSVGNIETRVVEENESVNGKTVEISRNYYAFCGQTGSIYYFGEEVDIYKNGKVVSHEGAWTAEGINKPGVAMPGLILLGARYYQEMAPGVAMDRAEIISMNETMLTPAGQFTDILRTEETNALKPGEKEYKYYAPGIGLIKDEDLLLVKYGLIQ